jgi:diguanylate cyclase (GGDEF)-like protein/PAS domain S-box-containing protein
VIQTTLSTRGHPLLPVACGAFALLVGILVLIGWLTHAPILLRLGPDFPATVASTGLCLALSGFALAAPAMTWGAHRRVSLLMGLPLVLIAFGMLCQTLFHVDLGIDMAAQHAWLVDLNPNPGRMAPATALNFSLLGMGLLIEAMGAKARFGPRFLTACALSVVVLSVMGLMAHFMRPELLFGWQGRLTRMAPYSAVSMLGLGLGYLRRWRRDTGRTDDPHEHRRRIFRTAAVMLTVVAVITGTAGFALQMKSVTDNVQDHLSRTLSDRRLVIEEALASAAQKVDLLSANPEVIAQLSAMATQGASRGSGEGLASTAASLLPHGFSYVAFEDLAGRRVSAGSSIGIPALEISLGAAGHGALAWRQGYFVRHRQPVMGAHGVIGHVIAEQPLRVLALLSAQVLQWGETYEMLLCTQEGARLVCFPQRLHTVAFSTPMMMKGRPLPMALALSGQTGVTTRLDFRQHLVMAAYAPLGTSGLGMVLKVDTRELYAPARDQLLMVLPMIVLTVLAGLWALRLRLQPVVRELVLTRQAAQANEARFVAAMESSLDAFSILRAERDQLGQVVDFRFTYVTVRGAALVSLTPQQVEGQLLCELLPINREAGFLEKYKAVLETGKPLAEEFPIAQQGVVASWISHQVVKLGDDSIAITSRDVSQRKHSEEALQQSEERMRMVTDAVPALIAYLSDDERYLFINQAGAELYGMPARDIVGKTVREVVGADNYALMLPHIDMVRAGYPVTYEREVVRADGVRHVLTSYFPQYDDRGAVTNVCALSHDITARKQMEAALALSQGRLKAVTDNVPALISYIDPEHRFRFANRAYQDWLGVEPESMIGSSLRELYGEAAYARIRPYLERAFAGETLSYERDLEAKHGPRYVHVTMTPDRNTRGEIAGLYVLMNDITPLKAAEKRSARSEERLTLALEGSHLALFDWDLSSNQVYNSAHWSSMLGGPAVETNSTLASLSELVHPEDMAGVMNKVAAAVKGSTPFYCAEHRVRMGNGDWLWILSRGRVVERDANGRALRLSGTNADISDQKRIEAQLQRMANIDSLTELPNRSLFHDRLNHALFRTRRSGSPMALMLLDVDYFKQINDGMGHDAGDAILQEFARRLMRTVRQSDTVARLGGDEFTIILEALHSAAEAEMIAAKVIAAMGPLFVHAGQSLRVTASVGVAYLDHADEDATSLVKRADQALYAAKAGGRNGYRCALPSM